jgi:hypothetical protein
MVAGDNYSIGGMIIIFDVFFKNLEFFLGMYYISLDIHAKQA